MAEYINTYVVNTTVEGADVSIIIRPQNIRTRLSDYMHNHVEHELLYILSGNAVLTYKNENIPLLPFQLCLIPAGLYHHISIRSENLRITSMRFQIKLKKSVSCTESAKIIHLLGQGTPWVFNLEHMELFRSLCEAFFSDTIRPPILYKDMLKSEATLILCHVFEQLLLLTDDLPADEENKETEGEVSIRQNTIKQIEHLFSEHFMEPLSLESVAASINMSKSGTHRLIKQLYGMGFSKKLSEARLIAARTMIENEDTPLYAIAEKCGFMTYDHFSKSFKTYFGTAPDHYRKEIEKEPRATP